MKLQRPAPPVWLVKNGKKWGQDYEQKKLADPQYTFRWRVYRKIPVNQHLVPILREMTKDHCSFCDLLPVVPYTLEHFRPKAKFPLLTYHWENLFICCGFCQQAKLELFPETLLKPDEIEYEYQRYFLCDPVTGMLEPNPKATAGDQQRAIDTINLYGLNDFGRPAHRRREIKKFALSSELTIDDFSFRFLFL